MNNTPITIPIGSKFKLQILIDDLPEPLTMEDIDFICMIGNMANSVTLRKRDLINPKPGVYVAPLDSANIGRGELWMAVSANIPDADYKDGSRTEIIQLKTNIIIV